MIKVGIVNFGMGNLNSVQNALKFLGCKYTVISNPNEFNGVSHIILTFSGTIFFSFFATNTASCIGTAT